MIIHMLVGALALGSVWFITRFLAANHIQLASWKWVLIALEIIYSVFVLEVIIGFFQEGAPQASLVMGLVTALPAVIAGVLIYRFLIKNVSATE